MPMQYIHSYSGMPPCVDKALSSIQAHEKSREKKKRRARKEEEVRKEVWWG